jgi:predicted dinucleotide-binding enzyme
MKIAVIGSGRIGSVVGKLWAKAGHTVVFSSRHPEQLDELVKEAGANASRTTIEAALAAAPEVIFLSIPYAAVEAVGRENGAHLENKIVLETGNPYPDRDGDIAKRVIDSGLGTGVWSARWLPGARVVRAFNSVWDQTLAKQAHRAGDQVGIPLASDDAEALQVAAQLVRDAGFDPVIVGGLERAKEFDVDTKVYNTNLSGRELRAALGV